MMQLKAVNNISYNNIWVIITNMLLGLGIVGDILQLKAEQLTWSTLKPTQASLL